MSEPFVGEIRMVGFNFAPNGWALCNGQTIPISQNETLFSLIGTTYGGDGVQTFLLPNFQSRVPIHMGQGNGLSNYNIGQLSGSETVTLNSTQIPSHNHSMVGTQNAATTTVATGNILALADNNVYNTAATVQHMAVGAILPAGGNTGHNNLQPLLTITFAISLYGVYPSRN